MKILSLLVLLSFSIYAMEPEKIFVEVPLKDPGATETTPLVQKKGCFSRVTKKISAASCAALLFFGIVAGGFALSQSHEPSKQIYYPCVTPETPLDYPWDINMGSCGPCSGIQSCSIGCATNGTSEPVYKKIKDSLKDICDTKSLCVNTFHAHGIECKKNADEVADEFIDTVKKQCKK